MMTLVLKCLEPYSNCIPPEPVSEGLDFYPKNCMLHLIPMTTALFIDRDGVINRMVPNMSEGFDSPSHKDQVLLVEGIVEVINYCNEKKVPVIEISNQPGVAKGKMTLEENVAIESTIHELLNKQKAYILDSYRCLHHPDALLKEYREICDCRKPFPGLLEKAAKEHNIDLTKSFFLGDNVSDMEAAKRAGCTGVLFINEEDTKEKVFTKKSYEAPYIVHNHTETLQLLQQLFT